MSDSSTEPEGKATSPRIEVYLSTFCPYCSFAKRLLKQQGLAFDRISVDFSRTRRAEMEARAGRDSVPQIFIGQTHVGGYDELAALVATGGLPAVLAKEGLSPAPADPTLQP